MAETRRTFGLLDLALIGVGAVAVGIVAAKLLDYHHHTCDACSRRWSHVGRLLADRDAAHRCPSCGTEQWWKDDIPRELRAGLGQPGRMAA